MRYAKIKPNDISNAKGISVSLFTQGCPHHCKGCFNQETWDFDGGEKFTQETLNEVLRLLNKNNLKRNLSILGGEPLLERNLEMLEELCILAKKQNPEIEIWLWTGFIYEEVRHLELLNYIDYIIDGKYIEKQRELTRYKGSKNQRVIKIKAAEK